MRTVTDRISNPFGMEPPCERFVPGYGDANAHFHVVGDHPGVHGGSETGVPFTDCEAGHRLQRALHDAGLLESTGDEPSVDSTYLSYLHTCVPDGDPTEDDYARMEPFFDAELRAIAAHVLLPVGERATRHVLETCTARNPDDVDIDALHATEVLGSGWLVLPIREPTAWASDDATQLVDAIDTLRATDYRRETDLGRFVAGNEPYLVR
ncbi:uracil-DNA glycosylase, family 4 [Haloplanus vescus]|uniref:Uracil-DNA glycosylase, family 4 n=1 Tax=Haloplanus vescus TaxID=555874 RepID=A0A1H3W154_9EURY|nr:uracil-DNA glycosylase family protein [Haloplanus vescus]SDZ80700.1 uracil-DNA glycosylase, family 4 [Haloplanus vescus]